MEKYTEVYRSEIKIYFQNSPLILETAAIRKNNLNELVFAQLRFRNIGETNISACKIEIEAYEANIQKLINVVEYSYLDLSVTQGQEFGSKEPIILPTNTRKIIVHLKEIVFITGKVLNFDGEYYSIPEMSHISNLLKDEELVEQFKLETSNNMNYMPQIYKDLFICSCGAVNLKNIRCYKCKYIYDTLDKILVIDELRNRYHLRALQEKEEQDRLLKEQEKQKQIKRSKRKKALIIDILFITIIGTSIIFFRPKIMGYYNTINIYYDAKKHYDAGQYLKASQEFEKIREYSDAEELYNQSLYMRGDYLFNEKRYKDAIDIWSNIPEYSDVQARLKEANICLSQQKYH